MNINILDVVRWSGEECGLEMESVDSGHQGLWSVTLVGGDSLGVTRNCSIMINVASPSQVSILDTGSLTLSSTENAVFKKQLQSAAGEEL